MSQKYVVVEKTDAYEVGRKNGDLIAACVCGSGQVARDKGLGRASIATWKSRHVRCGPTP